MLGKTPASSIKPQALGTTPQSSTYGMTIPVIFGLAKVGLCLIWVNNIRQYGSSKKGKGGGKKGGAAIPGYAAAVDCLIGTNPIAGVIQCWDNNQAKIAMGFDRFTATLSGGASQVTVTDTNFYAILAVTIDAPYDVIFNDYGSSSGAQALSGTFELPLWNASYQGPNPTNPRNSVVDPYSYLWVPGSGPTITLTHAPFGSFPVASPTVHVYYAKTLLDSSGNRIIPLSQLRLTFETQLGSGPEFSGYTSEQIIYPQYVGVGSPNLDLGVAGLAPNIRVETLGSYPLNPPYGDADFADMVENIFRMGITQASWYASSAFHSTQTGLGCYNYPGLIQKTRVNAGAVSGTLATSLNLNITNGDPLLLICTTGGAGTVGTSVTDAAGLTWTSRFSAGAFNVWTANAAVSMTVTYYVTGLGITYQASISSDWTTVTYCPTSGQPYPVPVIWSTIPIATAYSLGLVAKNSIEGIGDTATVTVSGASVSQAMLEVGGLDTLDGVASNSGGSGDIPSGTVTVANSKNQPGFIVAVYLPSSSADAAAAKIPANWKEELAAAGSLIRVFSRSVTVPGAYTIQLPNTATGSWTMVLAAYHNAEPVMYPKPLGDILDQPSLELTRLQCRANGLWGSLVMDNQQKAADWLTGYPADPNSTGSLGIYAAMNAAPVWSGFKLKSIPYSEVSAVGNGAVYIAPTASGPVADIPEEDFIAGPEEPPVSSPRTAQIDAPNVLQIQHPYRISDYNNVFTSQPDNGSISQFGTRKATPQVLNCVQDVDVARKILSILVRRQNILRTSYKFKLKAKWKLLEAMDVITIPEAATLALSEGSAQGERLPVRLTSITEDDKFQLDCEAEPFVYGLHNPVAETVTPPTPFVPNTGVVPALVNPPVIFEPPLAMSSHQGQSELWLAVSDPDASYGGCLVYMSTDGGSSYHQIGTLQGSAVTGVTLADWPATADPDTAHDLLLDLTESLGDLQSYLIADEDLFTYPCYLAGGSSDIPYELMTYSVCQLGLAHQYTLKATGSGNHLRRAVFSCPAAGEGVDHPSNTRFAFLPPGSSAVLKLQLAAPLVGTELKFKFCGFNTFGNGLQMLADVTAYSYTPTGLPGGGQLFVINGV